MAPEQQARAFLNSKQDAELAALFRSQPSSAVAANIDLDSLAVAGLARSFVALLHIQLAKDPILGSADESAAVALHSLVTDMPDQDIPFVCEVISLMATASMNISLGNEQKDTPLHLAARSSRLQICQSLVLHGADVLARNDKNRYIALSMLWHISEMAQLSDLASVRAALVGPCYLMLTACPFDCRTPGGQAKLDADVKNYLFDIETAAKDKRQKGSSALWDEKMKATQTESAFGVRCL